MLGPVLQVPINKDCSILGVIFGALDSGKPFRI